MSGLPSITIPPPTPVPQKTPRNESKPRPAPNRRSASTATFTSFPTVTGRSDLGGQRRPERKGSSHPSMFAPWTTVPVAASIEPGAPTPTPASPIGSTPASSSASRSVSASSKTTASGPTPRGVSRRALPSTAASPSVTTAWIFVPPRSRPPFILVTAATARPRRSACGSPGTPFRHRMLLGVARPLRDPERENDHRRLVLRRVERGAGALGGPDPVRARGDPLGPRGEKHALRGPARVEQDRALAVNEDRDDETGGQHVLGNEDGIGELLEPGSSGRHDERPRLRVPRRSGQPPGIEQPRRHARAATARERAALVATAGDREQRLHDASLERSSAPVR